MLAVAALFAGGAVDLGLVVQVAATAVLVVALVVLLSSAARSGPHVAAPIAAPPAASQAPSVAPQPHPGRTPLVSVVVPFHGDERFIEACLQSVLEQDYPNWELVAVDDCGGDGSAAIVERYATAEPRIRLVRHDRNRGLAAARNSGVAHARGTYVTFLDGDDFLFPDSLRSRVDAAVAHDEDPSVAGSYCGWQLVPEEAGTDEPIVAAPRERVVDFMVAAGENPFIATAPLVRRDVVVAVRGFDEEFRTAEDFDFWMRVLRHGYRFVPAGIVGVAYRQKRMGMISEGPAHHARNARTIYDYLDRPMWREEAAADAPELHVLSLGEYQRNLQWLGRLASFLFFALAHGDRRQVDELLGLVPPSATPALLFHGTTVDEAIDAAVRRWNLKSGALLEDDEARIRAETVGLLLEAVSGGAGATVPAAAPADAPLRVGSLDIGAARRRAALIMGGEGTAPASADVWLLALTAQPAPSPLRAERAVKQLVVAVGPDLTLDEDVQQALEALATDTAVVRARKPGGPRLLTELAWLAAGRPEQFLVLVDRLPATAHPGQTTAEQELAEAVVAPPLPRDPVTLLAVDGPGQGETLVAATTDAPQPVRLLDLGPFADPATIPSEGPGVLTPAALFHPDLSVREVVAVYPYGPYVSKLVEAMNDAGVPTRSVAASCDVDWLEEAAAARPDGGGGGPGDGRWKAGVLESWLATNRQEARRRREVLSSQSGVPVARFRDRHRGERCFIIGNGPSLNKLDLAAMKDDVTFGVNGIFLAEETMGYAVTYYMVEDDIYMKENVPEIVAYDAGHKFFPSEYVKYFESVPGNVSFFEMDGRYYQRSSPLYCVPRFSTDFSLRGYCGQSVTLLNLQLAYYMGFTEVVMIGMDFSYTIPDSVVRDGNHLLSTEDDPNHFHPDYFGKGRTWKDPKLDRVLASYQLAKRVYEEDGRRIINATAGGKLELFPRVDYDGLF